jgi:hypothetical protein
VTQFPVSVKGVVFRDGRAILLRNERDEWELPGGKLDPHESPVDCCARETKVLIVTYGCTLGSNGPIEISSEHKQVGLFSVDELQRLPMPEGYRASVRRWWKLRHTG